MIPEQLLGFDKKSRIIHCHKWIIETGLIIGNNVCHWPQHIIEPILEKKTKG